MVHGRVIDILVGKRRSIYWSILITLICVGLFINNQVTVKHLTKVAEQARDKYYDLLDRVSIETKENEVEVKQQIEMAMQATGLDKVDGFSWVYLRAIASVESGCSHFRNGKLLISATNDIGMFQIHCTQHEVKVARKGKPVFQYGVDVTAPMGNTIRSCQILKSKMNRASSRIRNGENKITISELKLAIKYYNGAGPRADRYSKMVFKVANRFKESNV